MQPSVYQKGIRGLQFFWQYIKNYIKSKKHKKI